MESQEPKSSESEDSAKKHEFVIYIDAVRYVVTQTSMSGSQIKALAGKDAQYQLFLEEVGDQPDKAIDDNTAVHLRNDMHFYAIPPATFGSERTKPRK